MRPDPTDVRELRQESTPDNMLLIDLVHRSVKRMFDGDAGSPAAAPTVKVVNLSVGDLLKPLESPARHGAARSPRGRVCNPVRRWC